MTVQKGGYDFFQKGWSTTTSTDEDVLNAVIKDTVGPELSEDTAGTTAEGGTIAVGGTSAASAAISANFIDVVFEPDATTTLGCYITIGTAPVAQANDYFMVSNTPYRFRITSGNKIAAIQKDAAGDLYWHPVE